MKNINDFTGEIVDSNWDREASIFWQEISQHQEPSKPESESRRDPLQSTENHRSTSQQDTLAFWEELAMQRT